MQHQLRPWKHGQRPQWEWQRLNWRACIGMISGQQIASEQSQTARGKILRLHCSFGTVVLTSTGFFFSFFEKKMGSYSLSCLLPGGGDTRSDRSVDFLQITRITWAIFLLNGNCPDSIIGMLLPKLSLIKRARGKKKLPPRNWKRNKKGSIKTASHYPRRVWHRLSPQIGRLGNRSAVLQAAVS